MTNLRTHHELGGKPRPSHAIAPVFGKSAFGIAILVIAVFGIFSSILLTPTPALAQDLPIDLGGGSTTALIIQIIALVTVLSLAPSILVMVTSFTRIVVVLSFLRSALGVQQTPPNAVLISLALFLTFFIMAPVFEDAYRLGIEPLLLDQIDEMEAFALTVEPFREFMLAHVREQDLRLFLDMADIETVDGPEDVPLQALIPSFMISELRRAFEIGFLLFLPFLIIDMVVASILMSMGMMMLPPVMISLPFKIIFFVLVDGWYLVAGSLVQSYGI
jgi:flagellar biosynthesis protein FliP